MGRTVGIVFDAVHLGRYTIFIAAKINVAVKSFMSATAVTDRDLALVVTAGDAPFPLRQGLEGFGTLRDLRIFRSSSEPCAR